MKNNAIANSPVPVFPTEEIQRAIQLTDQYRKAISGTREVLIFGAMMCELGVVLELQNNSHGPQTKGEGLKSWIEENCPSINYKTAHSFYNLASRMRDALSIPLATNIHRLLTAPVEALSKKEATIRAEMDGAIDGKSARQLEIDFGIRKAKPDVLPAYGGAREGAGRPKATMSYEQTKIDLAFSDDVLGSLGSAVLEKRWHIRLDQQKKALLCAIALAIAEDLCSPELRSAIRTERERDLRS